MDNILGIVSATRDLYGKIKLQEMDLKMVQDLEMVQTTGAFAESIEKYLSAISRGFPLHPPAVRKDTVLENTSTNLAVQKDQKCKKNQKCTDCGKAFYTGPGHHGMASNCFRCENPEKARLWNAKSLATNGPWRKPAAVASPPKPVPGGACCGGTTRGGTRYHVWQCSGGGTTPGGTTWTLVSTFNCPSSGPGSGYNFISPD